MHALAQQDTAELGLPPAPPWHRVVVGPSPPRHFDGRCVGRPCDAGVDERLDLLQSVAEPVLEDRHEPSRRRCFCLDESVDVGERADDRLLAHDVLARGERGQTLVRGASTAACRCGRSRCRRVASNSSNDRTSAPVRSATGADRDSSGSQTATSVNRSRRRRSARTCCDADAEPGDGDGAYGCVSHGCSARHGAWPPPASRVRVASL